MRYGEVDSNGFWIHTKQFEKVESAYDLLEKAGLDSREWNAVKVEPNKYEVVVKDAEGNAHHETLWQIKGRFERKVPKHFTESVDSLLDGFSLNLPKIKKKKVTGDLCWLVGLVDHHFGKLAWSPEVGTDYDCRIAETLWMQAVDSTFEDISVHGKVNEILLPVGNDFYHFDTREGATTAGTPQHCDGRWQKVYETGQKAILYAIETLRRLAPVKVIWVPGNHDYLSSYWLCKLAEATFQKDKRVTFDISPDPIKYHSFGGCFFTFAHGQEPSYKALKDMVPVVRADDWSRGKAARELICGHIHQTKYTNYVGTWEEAGLMFRILPSLAATDFWHHTHGYTNSRHATQSIVYSSEHGFKSIFNKSVAELCEK